MSDGNIPIDIAVRKLLDWLVSRRICSRSWHESVCVIRQKVGEALKDMPEHPGIKQLLAGSNINYFTCLRIVEILKETESNSKEFYIDINDLPLLTILSHAYWSLMFMYSP